MTNEEYLTAALELDANGFLEFFQQRHCAASHRYEELCRANSRLEEYYANPLVFILGNEPPCCMHIAKAFVDDRRSQSIAAGETADCA